MLTWPVTVVGWLTSIVQQAEASQKRINKFLKEKTEIKDGINNQKIKIYFVNSIEKSLRQRHNYFPFTC